MHLPDRARSAKPMGEGDAASSRGRPESARRADDAPDDHYLGDLYTQLSVVVKSNPTERFTNADGTLCYEVFAVLCFL